MGYHCLATVLLCLPIAAIVLLVAILLLKQVRKMIDDGLAELGFGKRTLTQEEQREIVEYAEGCCELSDIDELATWIADLNERGYDLTRVYPLVRITVSGWMVIWLQEPSRLYWATYERIIATLHLNTGTADCSVNQAWLKAHEKLAGNSLPQCSCGDGSATRAHY